MYPRFKLATIAVFVGCLAGCLSPSSVRYPTLFVGDPRVERHSLERHDPFPSRSMGPETNVRPQGHVDQRTDVRRLREENALRGLDRRRIPAEQTVPTTNYPYPGVVRE